MIFKKEQLIKKLKMGFPWGPAVKTALSAQRGWVLSLVGELRYLMPRGQKNTSINDFLN